MSRTSMFSKYIEPQISSYLEGTLGLHRQEIFDYEEENAAFRNRSYAIMPEPIERGDSYDDRSNAGHIELFQPFVIQLIHLINHLNQSDEGKGYLQQMDDVEAIILALDRPQGKDRFSFIDSPSCSAVGMEFLDCDSAVSEDADHLKTEIRFNVKYITTRT